MKTEFRRYIRAKNADKFLKDLNQKGVSYSIREGSEMTEIYVDDTHYIYASDENFPKGKIYLFNVVKIDAERFLKNNKFKVPKEVNSVHYNYDFDLETNTLTGTDLNHAYWRIAYLMGVISEKTYIRGLSKDCKSLRLATLSVLGREKKFDKYENGELISSFVYKEQNPLLKDLYKTIRLYCYHYMQDASKLLGDDFFCWKTDCIYYKDTEENKKKVRGFFESKNLTYKQLGY